MENCYKKKAYNFRVFVTWTVTSFLCHHFGKTFLITYTDSWLINSKLPEPPYVPSHLSYGITLSAFILTGIQLAFCLMFVTVDTTDTSSIPGQRSAKLWHALATLATNISMALMASSSTFAIKMMEPVTSAIVQYFSMGTQISLTSAFSLPFIMFGAIGFAGNPLATTGTAPGMLGALASNVILAFRNVVLKKMSHKNNTLPVKFRNTYRELTLPLSVIVMGLSMCLFLESHEILPRNTTLMLLYACISGTFHVAYSYVSTALVLTQVSVVSHAVANIMKRLLVVLLLYMFGQRVATVWNFAGLVVCTVGLLVYTLDKARPREKTTNKSNKKRWYMEKSFFQITKLKNIRHHFIMSLGRINALLKQEGVSRLRFGCGQSIVGVFAICLLVITYSGLRETSYRRNRLTISGLNLIGGRLFNTSISKTAFDADLLMFTRSNTSISNQLTPFDADGFVRPTQDRLIPNLNDLPNPLSQEMLDFLMLPLQEQENIENVNFLSEKLSTTAGVIQETHRLHFNVIGKELERFKYAFLMDIAAFENKGDPAITIGEIYFLARMNIEVKYYCSASRCTLNRLEKAREMAKNYSTDELVILVHGGGNIVGYAVADLVRFNIIKIFHPFKILVFPQSIWIRDWRHPHVHRTAINYCCHPNLTIVLRDSLSYSIAKRLYKGTTRLLMAPDMAFQIGRLPRFMSPVFDVMWVKRKDLETPSYQPPKRIPRNLKVHVSDWWKWLTPPASSHLEKAFYIATNGFFFLQRGRVVITDRLHGHILATLMDIPHVLIDNKARKLSSYHNTWTRSLSNTVITDDPNKALDLAIGLLKKYNETLPPVVPFLNLREDFSRVKLGIPDTLFP